jgi:hypothetical protein
MKELDGKSQTIMKNVEKESTKFQQKVRELNGDQRTEMLKGIDALLKDCLKHGEEKVQLAVQTYDMVDRHIKRLDDDLAKFEEEQMTGPKLLSSSSGLGFSNRYHLVNEKGPKFGGEDGRGKRDKTRRNNSGETDGRKKRSRVEKVAESIAETPVVSTGNTPRKQRGSISGASKTRNASTAPVLEPSLSDHALNNAPPASNPGRRTAKAAPLDLLPVDPNERIYCLCNQISFGEMIACDNTYCEIEWFHYSCVGLEGPPKGKWYCPVCEKGNLHK